MLMIFDLTDQRQTLPLLCQGGLPIFWPKQRANDDDDDDEGLSIGFSIGFSIHIKIPLGVTNTYLHGRTDLGLLRVVGSLCWNALQSRPNQIHLHILLFIH